MIRPAVSDVIEERFDVEDRGTVEGFEVADLDAWAVDCDDLDSVETDGIRTVGGSGTEDSFLGAGFVSARVDTEDVAVGAIKPGEEEDSFAYLERRERVEDGRVEVQPSGRGAFVGLAGGGRRVGERRDNSPDGAELKGRHRC